MKRDWSKRFWSRLLRYHQLTRFWGNQGRLRAYRWAGAEVGTYVFIDPRTKILFDYSHVSIGEGSLLDADVEIHAWDYVRIGDNVFLNTGVKILTASHYIDSPDFRGKVAPVTIQDRSWLATECLILPGVTIGEGAVVGARAVVTKDVPPYTVVGGNPAKILKERPRLNFTYVPADWKLKPRV